MESFPRSFIRRQVLQIRTRGPGEAIRRAQWLILACLAITLALAVWALRPLVTIRIGRLASSSIGSLAIAVELHLCEKDTGMHGLQTFDVFYTDKLISNFQLKKMWQRKLFIPGFTSILEKASRRLPERHVVPWRTHFRDQDIYGLLPVTKPHLSFTAAEEERGRQALAELGVGEDSFVCFHARDTAFTVATEEESNQHESTFRNCSVENFLPAAEEMASRNYFALRMGSMVQRPLTSTGPRVIDYATVGRTDFLDIYLSAKCRFFIGSTTGLYTVPQIFRRPLVLTNFVSLIDSTYYGPDDLFIPKQLWSIKDQRFLSINEILDTGIAKFLHTEQYEELGIELIENTSEEITDVVLEMEERLEGRWQATEEDEELQRMFWIPFKKVALNQDFGPRIGAKYLRDHKYLLDGATEPDSAPATSQV